MRALRRMRASGFHLRWQEEVRWAFSEPSEKRWYYRWIEVEWETIDTDPEALGIWLADYFADLTDYDDETGHILINSAWTEVEGFFMPEQAADGEAGEKWWSEVEWAFRNCMQDISDEWLADRKYGHPSLTAAERNPGLSRGIW
jgi:hypothetical protein